MEWDGYKGGEIASKLAIEAARTYIEGHFDKITYEKETILELIKSAMDYANNVVFEKSKSADELIGMGTTLEICLIYNNRAYIGHIGDSRIYRIRGTIMRKLTTDHSYVETLVKGGTITKEEAKHHPKKNMLMKALRMCRRSRTRCNGQKFSRRRYNCNDIRPDLPIW